jgi:hypothetical protein
MGSEERYSTLTAAKSAGYHYVCTGIACARNLDLLPIAHYS